MDRDSNMTKMVVYSNYAEAMPNFSFTYDGSTYRTSDSAVRGHIVGVDKGRAWMASDDGEKVTEMAFDGQGADWKSLHLRVVVDELMGGVDYGKEILVGLTFTDVSADFDRLSVSLKGLGEVVLPLTKADRNFAYDPRVVGVADSGNLLAQVGPDGALSLPFVDPDESGELLNGTRSLSQLQRSVAQPSVTLAWKGTG